MWLSQLGVHGTPGRVGGVLGGRWSGNALVPSVAILAQDRPCASPPTCLLPRLVNWNLYIILRYNRCVANLVLQAPPIPGCKGICRNLGEHYWCPINGQTCRPANLAKHAKLFAGASNLIQDPKTGSSTRSPGCRRRPPSGDWPAGIFLARAWEILAGGLRGKGLWPRGAWRAGGILPWTYCECPGGGGGAFGFRGPDLKAPSPARDRGSI
jgi:hypothetical protein